MEAAMDLLPFLYQTRTILRLGSAGARLRLRGARQSPIRKVSIDSPALSSSLSSSPPPPPPSSSPSPPSFSSPDDAVDPKTRFFQLQAKRRAAAAAGEQEPELPKPVITSTITPEEQRAFARLHELALRQQSGLPPPDTGRLNVNPESILGIFLGPPQRRPGPQHQGYERHEPEAAHVDSWAEEGYQQLETAVAATRWPKTRTHPRPSSHTSEDAVARFCRRQMRNYYRTFNEALHSTTVSKDVAVLDILRKQVFPLLELITPPPPPSSESLNGPDTEATSSSKKKSKAKAKAKTDASVNQDILALTASATTTKGTASPLAIVSRLYPAATLLALRLLAKHQPLSAITSSLLSIIRDLGPTSYVLAANAHFYNTLLFLRWNVFSSLSEVCALLGEMERGAVEFDKGTAAFLADLAEERARDLYTATTTATAASNDDHPPRGAQWWRKHEQEKWWPRIEEWRRIITGRLDGSPRGSLHTTSIDADDDGNSMKERPYSSLMDQRAEDVDADHQSRQVWL